MKRTRLLRRLFLILMVFSPFIGGWITLNRMTDYHQTRAQNGHEQVVVTLETIDDRLEEGTSSMHSLDEISRVTRPGIAGLGLGILGLFGWIIFSIKTRCEQRHQSSKQTTVFSQTS